MAAQKILLVFTEIQQKFGALHSQHGLASISAVLKKKGYPVELAYFSDHLYLDRFLTDIKRFQPTIIGFYSTAEQFHFIKKLVEKVPPGIFTILGGPHPTCYPICLENILRLDAVCVGEGEYPMLDLVEALQNNKDYTRIKNLWVRWDGQIIRNETRPFIKDLDSLPFVDREIFNTQEAINQYGMSQIRVMTSRGCPFQCTYCSNHKQARTQPGGYVRFRSADHIMEELKQLKDKYNFDEIFFDDDIFMMNRKVVEEFCRRFPREIGKSFVFCGRVEVCDKDLLSQLKAAGGRRIDFGIESGNEELRRNVLKRNMTNEQILKATSLAKSVGLEVKTLNMVGLPEETMAKFQDTVKINQMIQPDVASLSIFYPYPGTELYDYCLKKGYLDPEESLPENYVSRRQSLLSMPYFSREEIGRCFRRFTFDVFKKQVSLKALAYTIIYSSHGEFLIPIFKKFRRLLKKILKGL